MILNELGLVAPSKIIQALEKGASDTELVTILKSFQESEFLGGLPIKLEDLASFYRTLFNGADNAIR